MALSCSSPCKSMQKKKGMILVLLWNFSVYNVFEFIRLYETDSKIFSSLVHENSLRKYFVIFGFAFLLFPLFGWIADNYCGRYKMIRYNLFIMWVTTIVFCLVSFIPDDLPRANTIREVSYVVLIVILLFSFGAIQANIIQFGLDQLPDASSTDVIAFSNWYVWIWNASTVLVEFPQECLHSRYLALGELLLPASLTLALCLDYNFNHWLIKEPALSNPFKLIYRVMCFAWKNKYPRQRSAFTYCDDEHYSRIDFAKQKFGGPFTTEEVEDVKNFWRMVMVMVVSSIFVGFFSSIELTAQDLKYMLSSGYDYAAQYSSSEKQCFERVALSSAGYILVILWIPLMELLPIPHSLLMKLTIWTKFNIGFFIALMSIVGYLLLDLIGHIKLGGNAMNVTCLLELDVVEDDTPLNLLPLDHKWAMIPYNLYIISIGLMATAAVQFISAQSPYSMKGLMFGLGYGISGVSISFNYLILLPITSTAHKWPSNRYGCGTWYLLSASIVLLVMLVLLCVFSRKYKRRQRADVLPNEHIFAINYYSRYTMQNCTVD